MAAMACFRGIQRHVGLCPEDRGAARAAGLVSRCPAVDPGLEWEAGGTVDGI